MHILSKEFPEHIISMWQISREKIYMSNQWLGDLLAQLPSPLQKENLVCLFLPLFFIFQGLTSRLREKKNSLLLEMAEGVQDSQLILFASQSREFFVDQEISSGFKIKTKPKQN